MRNMLLGGNIHRQAARSRNVQHVAVPWLLGDTVHQLLELQVGAKPNDKNKATPIVLRRRIHHSIGLHSLLGDKTLGI